MANGVASEFIDNPRQRELPHEVIQPLTIASIQGAVQRRDIERTATLFDLYLDEERPFIIGEASKSIGESVEFLQAHHTARLSVETFCDQRNTTAYGMVLSHQRTWQIQDFLHYLEIPNSRVVTVSYGKEGFQCRENSTACWEEQIRVQSAFKYLAISQTKLGCLVRLGVTGVEKELLNIPFSDHSKFLQKIKLAPVHKRRRLRHYVYRSPSTSSAPVPQAIEVY
ncbi:MAG: OmpA family protein [Nitrospirales bacterium]